MISKTEQAVQAFKAGDVKLALKLASGFRLGITQQESKTLKRGYECIVHPRTYMQMGIVPEAAVSEACTVFQRKFIEGV